MGTCTNCGTEIKEGARICHSCGSPYSPQQQSPQQQASPQQASPQQAGPTGQPAAPLQQPPAGPTTWQTPQSFGPGGAARAVPTDGQAIASLVCGILGIFFVPIILPIVAIVLGKTSMNRIKASEGALQGHQIAMAGFIVGIVGVVLGVIFIGLFVLFMGALFTSGGGF